MTTGRINQVTRRNACAGSGNRPEPEPTDTQRNTVEIQFLALERSKDRQTANKFLPPGNVRTLAREASARTRETTRLNRKEDRYSPGSTVKCQATVHAVARNPEGSTGKLHSGTRRREQSTAKSLRERPITNSSQPTAFSPT
jgi:hypothetical protein